MTFARARERGGTTRRGRSMADSSFVVVDGHAWPEQLDEATLAMAFERCAGVSEGLRPAGARPRQRSSLTLLSALVL